MNDPYNAFLLDGELKASGLTIYGCSSKGRIDWVSPPTSEELARAGTILAAHDPNKASRLEQLRAKRRTGLPLTPLEQQELLDLLLGV